MECYAPKTTDPSSAVPWRADDRRVTEQRSKLARRPGDRIRKAGRQPDSELGGTCGRDIRDGLRCP